VELANAYLALGGDTGHTVPQYDVTPAQVAVLEAIHGAGSVTEIEVIGVAQNEHGRPRSNREELRRVKEIYGHAKNGNGIPYVEMLYPGAAARVFEAFDELELIGSQFKTKAAPKAATNAAPAPDMGELDLDDMTKAQIVAFAKREAIEIDAGRKKDDLIATIRRALAERNTPADDDEGEDEDIDDEHSVIN